MRYNRNYYSLNNNNSHARNSQVMIGEDKLLRFSGCKSGEACTVVLRGASNQILDEAERSLHDALCVLTRTVVDTRTVYGGGCTEIQMAAAVDVAASSTPGKKIDGYGGIREGSKKTASNCSR
mmetsp:Transcript_5944/g.12636  ORF Transcript_5944/g.12636 Transcript_5944/m.12636 type:complete len:123 (+) Transcript_5944:1472-1840(+)